MAKVARAAGGVTAIDIARDPAALELKPVYAVFGDEEFLRTAAIAAIRQKVLGSADNDFALSRFDGRTCSAADVLDEVSTLAFLGGRRLVIVADADDFVSANRDSLERYVQKPHSSGVLVLSMKSFPSSTRLAKFTAQVGAAFDCRLPDARELAPWCRRWAKDRYAKTLAADAADLLVELAGGGLGALDSELDKLAAYVGSRGSITAEDVDKLVAAGRVETVWKIIDSAAGGDAPTALHTLRSLTNAGEAPMMILGAMSSQLRRLAKGYRLARAGEPPRSALTKAGINPYFAQKAEDQLRRLGRDRLDRLYTWLLETDLGLKGDSALEPEHVLERLVVRLAAK